MRQGIQILAVTLVLLLVGFVAYQMLFHDETYSLLVKSSEHAVLRGADGKTRSLAVGDTVSVGDRVQTEDGGSAALTSGESELSLQANSSMLIKKLDETGIQVEIDGRLTAHVRNVPFTATDKKGRSVYASDADFTVAADPDGTVAVDTTRGEVTLGGFGGVATAGAGSRVSGGPDGDAVKSEIPDRLLLEVAWPEASITRDASITVHGHADPYAKVKVGTDGAWREVRADGAGAFATDIALAEGPNTIEVRAQDPMGGQGSDKAEIERKSKPPSGTVGVDYSGH